MKKVLISLAIFSIFCSVFSRETTSSEDFIRRFQVRHITQGDGENFPFKGDEVTVHYVGTFANTGEVLDSSHQRNEPLNFTLGHNHVIPCWDEVIQNMSKGEKIYFVCPHSLAYGEAGAGSIIPPNSDLGFEIELISYQNKQEEVTPPQAEVNQHSEL